MEQRTTKSNKRNVDGILLLDKPINMTSNHVLQVVKRLFNARKAGHTGSLDPLASGVLPICFGQATKFSQYLLEANKHYRVVGKLGITTTTGDTEGEILENKEIENISLQQIEKALLKFEGVIEQIPSMYSAIKHNGQPLYKLARQGITIDRKPRTLTIFKLELIMYEEGFLELDIVCSKGTYVRTLIEDIGKELGCGAHVVSLRRLGAGVYSEQQSISLQKLEALFIDGEQKAADELLFPVASIFSDWREVCLSEAALYYLRQGQAVIVPYAPANGDVSLLTKNGQFLGIGKILDDGKVAPVRLVG